MSDQNLNRVRAMAFALTFVSYLGNHASGFEAPGVANRSASGGNGRPNILIIVADDFGRELLGCYGGQTDYHTRSIESLASEGMRFDVCYATPMCAPSRVMLLTGRYSFRNYTRWELLDRNEATFAQIARDAGYRTAMAGKWHPFGGWQEDVLPPHHAGFKHFCSWDSQELSAQAERNQGNRFWGGTINVDGVEKRLDRYGPDFYSDDLASFICTPSEQPFLAYYAMAAMHRPFQPTPDHPDAPAVGQSAPTDWLGKRGEAANFAPMVHYADKTVGKLLKAIEDSGQRENTIVIFTADNGTDNVNEARSVRSRFMDQSVRGGKYFPTELGVNVPLLIRWPNVIESGMISSRLVDLTDIFATVIDAAKAKEPKGMVDGRSLMPVLRGETATDTAKPYVVTWGNYENNSSKYKDPVNHYPGKLQMVVRGQRYKWFSDGRLFDLQNDFLETQPIPIAENDQQRRERQVYLDQIRSHGPRRW